MYCIVRFNGPRDPAGKDTVANLGSTPSVEQRGITIFIVIEINVCQGDLNPSV